MKRTIKQAFILSMIAITTSSVAFAQAPSVALISSETKTVGNQMEIMAAFNLSDLHLKANRTLVIYPVVTGLEATPAEGMEKKLPLLIINGYKRHILFNRNPAENVATEAKRYNGKDQSVDYKVVIPKENWMNLSKINYYYDLCGCGNESQEFGYLTTTDIPNEIYWIPLSVKYMPEPIVRKGQAFIQFSLDKAIIDPTLGKNGRELDKIIEMIEEVKADDDTHVAKISIHGYASPEGRYEHNAELAQARTQAVVDFIQEKIQLEGSIIETGSTPEDMDGLLRELRASTYPEKDKAISYIEDETLTPDQKEYKIKSLAGGQLYTLLKKGVLPKLRHSDYFISYNEMTKVEINEGYHFPEGSPEAINNQGVVDIKEGRINQAKIHFERAAHMGLETARKNLLAWGKIYQWK